MTDEAEWISENAASMTDYLSHELAGFQISEKSEAPFYYLFAAKKEYEVYKLKVAIPRLADRSYTPQRITSLLRQVLVANKMRECWPEDFFWGW